MSFKENFKEQKGKQLYTGVATFNVIAVNPTKAELVEIYGNDEISEPSYVSTNDEGKSKLRLDFYIQNEENNIITKYAIFLEDKERKNRDQTKFQFINGATQTAWGENINSIIENPKFSWYKTETARIAKIGEEELYKFLIKVTNAEISNDSNLVLSNYSELLKGNVAEIRDIINSLGKPVRLLLTVKDGKYQSIYNKFIQRGHIASNNGFTKALEDENTACMDEYQNSLDLKVYVPVYNTSQEITTKEEDSNDMF